MQTSTERKALVETTGWYAEKMGEALAETSTIQEARALMAQIAMKHGLKIEDDILITDPMLYACDGYSMEDDFAGDTEPQDAADQYVASGDWGDADGSVSVRVYRKGIDVNGSDASTNGEWLDADIPIDKSGQIRAAAYGAEICGEDDDDHDWTGEGEGGCDENPGVWSNGGTTMTFDAHCRCCGLHRTTISRGFQRNPGEASETTEYRMLDADEIAAHRENGTMDEEA